MLLIGVGLILAFMVYRLWAIIDAYRTGRDLSGIRPRTTAARVATATVVLLLLGRHGGDARLRRLRRLHRPRDAGGGLRSGRAGRRGDAPADSHSNADPDAGSQPVDRLYADGRAHPDADTGPDPTPPPAWAADGRLNVLLIGSDAGPGRFSQRADAIILASVDIETGRVAAFSLPRYTYNVPLPEPAASSFECAAWSSRSTRCSSSPSRTPRCSPARAS